MPDSRTTCQMDMTKANISDFNVRMKETMSVNNEINGDGTREVLQEHTSDRRNLNWVPLADGKRITATRRGENTSAVEKTDYNKQADNFYVGVRYNISYQVKVSVKGQKQKTFFQAKAVNISGSGMLLSISPQDAANLEVGSELRLQFEITPGSMPEGYEMKVDINATAVRITRGEKDAAVAVAFAETLGEYHERHGGRFSFSLAVFFLFVVSLAVILMRTESVLYFKFNKTLYLYSIITAVFLLSRYAFALFYKPVKVNADFTPGVTIIIPCFNEETWIQRTILGCLNQSYPLDKLEIIVVDDCSTDHSVEKIKEIYASLEALEQYKIKDRFHYICQEVNKGKREAMAAGVKQAAHDLVVFVDSDSFLEPFAIMNLVQPFKDDDMGGVSGRTDIANTYTNSLTKMQAVRYYIAFRVMKAAEGFFDTVSCLSGPLSCYRKKWVLENVDAWLNQQFLGQRATFGDDRSMTNFILRHHRTTYQDTAVCNTIVPSSIVCF